MKSLDQLQTVDPWKVPFQTVQILAVCQDSTALLKKIEPHFSLKVQGQTRQIMAFCTVLTKAGYMMPKTITYIKRYSLKIDVNLLVLPAMFIDVFDLIDHMTPYPILRIS